MSAREPSYTGRIVTFHGNPESTLGIFLERGYAMRLHEPEIQSSTIRIEVGATRQEIRAAREEDWRRVAQYHKRDHQTPAETSRAKDYIPDSQTRRIRVYFEPDEIVNTLRRNDVEGSVAKLRPYHCFKMVRFNAPRDVFRTMQFEWLLRLISQKPTPIEGGDDPCPLTTSTNRVVCNAATSIRPARAAEIDLFV